MNSDNIEKIGIETINSYFKYSELISTQLTVGDKGIAWDGFLNIFSNPAKSKDYYIGRVSVQSKGKVVKGCFKEKNFMYQIDAKDLKIYQKEGTVYFVTQILEEKQQEKLFYRKLTPVLIANILRAHRGIEKPSVKMMPVPEDVKTMEAEMSVFMEDCHKQAISTGKKTISIEEAKKKGIKTFTFVASNRDRNGRSLADYLTEKELYLYALVDEEYRIELPVEEGPMMVTARQVVPKPISVNGKVYYESYINEIKEGEVDVTIGNCIFMTFPKDGSTPSIAYKRATKMLSESIHEADFILNVAKYNGFSIGDMVIGLNVTGTLIDQYKEALKAWNDWKYVLTTLGCNADFDLSAVTEEDDGVIGDLVDMIKYKRPVIYGKMESNVLKICIANITLILWCYQASDGKCMMGSLFDHSIEMHCQIGSSGRVPASPFSFLDKENWQQIDNIPLEKQIPYYEEMMPRNAYLLDMVCTDVFSMMAAYDGLPEDSHKKAWLLEGAETVVDWAMTKNGNEKVNEHLTEFKQQIGLRKQKA